MSSRLEALNSSVGTIAASSDVSARVAFTGRDEISGLGRGINHMLESIQFFQERRQKAEEMAAKTTIKLVPPLVFFIFPSIGIVTVLPAVITVMENLAHIVD